MKSFCTTKGLYNADLFGITFIFEFQLQYVQIRYVGTGKQELSKQGTDSFQKDSILHETIFVFIYK